LFGSGSPEKVFKAMAKLCHPDAVREEGLKVRAQEAFAKLSNFYAEINGKKPSPFFGMKLGSWTVEGILAKGDVSDLYVAEAGVHGRAALKIARDSRDNDLLAKEA